MTQGKKGLVVYNSDLSVKAASNATTTTFATQDFRCLDRVDVTLISAVLPAPGATVLQAFDDITYIAHVKQ